MKIRRTLAPLIALALATAACGSDGGADTTTTEGPETTSSTVPIEAIHLRWDLSEANGWEAGFSDFSIEQEPMDVDSGIRPLPEGSDEDGEGFMITGSNTSDDLFMFLEREVGSAEGLEPSTTYRATLRFAMASGAPSGCVGIGGAPGESVYVKAGVAARAPAVQVADGYHHFSLDKGNQSQGGSVLGLVGDVANGLECEEALETEPRPFRTLTFDYEAEVTADDGGSIWIVVGTDSGFEGITTLYYRWVTLNLEPV